MNVKVWIGVGLGSGLSPVAPGTTGTLGVLPLVYWCWGSPLWVWLVGLGVLCALALWSIGEAGRVLGAVDHGQIVIDEWAGMWIAAMACDRLLGLPVVSGMAIAFVGFRVFDIAKPWPVSWCEQRLPGSLGVLADDLAAGLYVAVLALVVAGILARVGV